MVLTTFSASSSLLRERLVLVEVQVLGTAVVPLLLQDLLVLVLGVELLAHDNSFWSRAEKSILREVERLKPGGSRRNAGLCGCKS